jgi:hypothetical protein
MELLGPWGDQRNPPFNDTVVGRNGYGGRVASNPP